jgi:hypothetical protein
MHALTSAEDEKIRKYHDACESSKGGSFTPFVMSADGVLLAPQATKFLETLATHLTEKQTPCAILHMARPLIGSHHSGRLASIYVQSHSKTFELGAKLLAAGAPCMAIGPTWN